MRLIRSRTTRARTPFFGRERELSLLLDELRRGTGLLTLSGPSGMGKTRLARQVASEIGASFETAGDAWFCPLAGCKSAADLEAAVARTLGIPQKQGEELARAIATRGPTLLLLDNVDTIAPLVGGVLGTWLDRCPELQMIATSLLPIGIEGEVRVEVGPLDAEDAVLLYLDRAHRASAGRDLSQDETPTIAELVGKLDRIPLAIELAAARVRVLPPRLLLSRFDERFELLRTSSEGRHSSLLEALTLTWDLLGEEEQSILGGASVFEGGFTYDAVVEIFGAQMRREQVLDILDGLRSKALLQIDDGEPPRFQLFESVKEFASRAIERAGLVDESRLSHAAYYLSRAEEHCARLEGKDSLESIRWLRAERENLLAVHQRFFDSRPDLAARAGLSLAPMILQEGHKPSEDRLSQATVEAGERSGRPELLLGALEICVRALRQQGQVKEALEVSERAISLARAQGDRRSEGKLLILQARLHMRKGATEKAAPLIELAARIGSEEDDPLSEGIALKLLGEEAYYRMSLDEAEGYANRSLAIFRANDFVLQEGLTYVDLAWVSILQGRFREGRRALNHALVVTRQLEYRAFEALVLYNRSSVELVAGDLDEAERYSFEAHRLHKQTGNRPGLAIVVRNLGIISLERGDLSLAASRLLEAEGILSECGARTLHAWALCFTAVLEARRGRLAEARGCQQAAMEHLEAVADKAGVASAELALGSIEALEAKGLADSDPVAAAGLLEGARRRRDAVATLAPELRTNVAPQLRLLEQNLLGFAAVRVSETEAAPSRQIGTGVDAGWFQRPGEERVILRRRQSLHRIFRALVEKRHSSPGVGMDAQELFATGWPGELPRQDVAMKRLYFAIWSLRKLGLQDLLLSQTDGYLLDPEVDFAKVED